MPICAPPTPQTVKKPPGKTCFFGNGAFNLKMTSENKKKQSNTSRKKADELEARKKRRLSSILVAIAIPFIICVSAPFEIYCGNMDELQFTPWDFLPFCLLLFAGVAGLLFLLLEVLPQKAYVWVFGILAGIMIMLFLQGNYLNQGIDSLKGDDVGGGGVSRVSAVLNTLCWVLVIEAVTMASVLLRKSDLVNVVCVIACIAVIGSALINCTVRAITVPDALVPISERGSHDSEDYRRFCVTQKNLTNISENKNVFVFVVDRFDDKYAAETMEDYPEAFSELEGFTYFNDNTSLYGHTYPSIVYMVTRNELQMTQHRAEYLDNAWENAETLKVLKNNGYEVNVYTEAYYSFNEASKMAPVVDNVTPTLSSEYEVDNYFLLSWQMIRMSLYRCLPIAAKDIVGRLVSGDCNRFVTYEAENPEYNGDNKAVHDAVISAGFRPVKKNVFTFLHTAGCHAVDYDLNWEPAVAPDIYDITISVRNNMEIINGYLRKMKEMGVYRDATIIITGDHAAAISDTVPLGGTRVTALFVKPAGVDSGELKISTAQVSHDNLWATIMKSAGIENDLDLGRSVFEVPEGESSVRRYFWHKYENPSTWTECYYEIHGSARIFSNWDFKSETDLKRSLYN